MASPSSSSSEDDGELLGAKAFSVVGEQEPSERAPATAEEYLRQVRWQARRCPNVVVAATTPQPQRTTGARPSRLLAGFSGASSEHKPVDVALLPSAAWRASFLQQFEAWRERLAQLRAASSVLKQAHADEKLPAVRDKQCWRQWTLGETGRAPATSLLLSMDHVTSCAITTYLAHWLLESSVLTKRHACWLFALLVRLELPLEADMAADLRAVWKHLVLMRSSLVRVRARQLPIASH